MQHSEALCPLLLGAELVTSRSINEFMGIVAANAVFNCTKQKVEYLFGQPMFMGSNRAGFYSNEIEKFQAKA